MHPLTLGLTGLALTIVFYSILDFISIWFAIVAGMLSIIILGLGVKSAQNSGGVEG